MITKERLITFLVASVASLLIVLAGSSCTVYRNAGGTETFVTTADVKDVTFASGARIGETTGTAEPVRVAGSAWVKGKMLDKAADVAGKAIGGTERIATEALAR